MLTENVYYSERPDKVYIYPYDGQRMCRADFPTDIEMIGTEEGEQYLCNVYSLRTNYEESLLEDMESNYEKWLDRAKKYVELRKRTMLKSVNRSATPNDLDSFTRFFDLGRTVYGGTLDVVSGELTDKMGYIASYNGETIGEPWISDRDEYVAGTTPSIGAEVVYTLATPQTYQLTPQTISLLHGNNNVWSDGEVELTYNADVGLYIDKKLGTSGTRTLSMTRTLDTKSEETKTDDTKSDNIQLAED